MSNQGSLTNRLPALQSRGAIAMPHLALMHAYITGAVATLFGNDMTNMIKLTLHKVA
jgi:uncharacterized membrane protein